MDRIFGDIISDSSGCWFEAIPVDEPPQDVTVYTEDDRELTRPVERLLQAVSNPETDYSNIERFAENGTKRFIYHPETENEVEETERLLDSLEKYTGGNKPSGVYFTNSDVTIAVVMACQT